MKKCFAVIVVLLIACVGQMKVSVAQGEGKEKSIQVKGAASMFGRVHTMAEMFEKTRPGVKVQVEKGKTVDEGIADLLDGNADVAMASRRLTEAEQRRATEQKVEIVEVLIGYGGVVFISNPSNPVAQLTVRQVVEIFTGQINRWSQLGGPDEPVKIYGVGNNHPGTQFYMQEELLKSPFAKSVMVLPEFSDVMRRVAETPAAIGYVRIRDAFELPVANEVKVKVLAIGSDESSTPVLPSRETVKNGSYPVRRPYYLYYTSKSPDEVKKFANFVVEKGWGKEGL